ncbi:hypothetical protein [Auraticoccus monumenti]|uniref:Uncharacterized protein n=1 Tax=Auraticoccus monumenti TaxID=675864 RepID=A0A1G6UK88_9ACTN|nr:hypothetical protein [Auraticoccus monumenti]SDD41691.1 hypothetical protein SAMN04489747_0905 [Auraticoccus monumenti]
MAFSVGYTNEEGTSVTSKYGDDCSYRIGETNGVLTIQEPDSVMHLSPGAWQWVAGGPVTSAYTDSEFVVL